jgi:hypothetical protein
MRVLRRLVFQIVENEHPETPIKINELRGFEFFLEILRALGALFGMAILWLLEIVRNRFFRLLDRLDFRTRRKRASAFPPGPNKHRRAA